VVTIHDLAFLEDESNFTRRGMTFFKRGLELALADADLVHAPSDATARDSVAAGFDKDKVRVVPLGFETSTVSEDEIAAVRARYNLDKPYVLWTGTIEPRKNLTALVEGFERSGTDRTLVLAGPSGWNEDVDRVIASVADRTKVLGFLPRHDLDALYAGADLFAWPSLKEGFGFPVLEAMAQGTPVITSRGTSTEELAGDAALLVDPTDVDQIAAAIADVLQDESLARKLSEAGRARVKGYSWASTARGLQDMYRELL
jgi:glycosyltransferase involved in cell wall biosynthesis